ncbi:immunoglobulin-like domain-containing protein [Lachnospiraceae bacterium 62-35]
MRGREREGEKGQKGEKKERKLWKTVSRQAEIVEKFPVQFHKMQIICAAAGILLYVAVKVAGNGNSDLTEGRIRRPAHGEGEMDCELYITGLEEEEIPIKIHVEEKQYGEEEALEIFEIVWQELLAVIPADNLSLSEVRSNLYLPSWLDSYGVRIRWYSENQDVLDNYGNVENEENPQVSSDGYEVWLRAIISDGEHETEFQIPVTIYPPLWSREEERKRNFQKLVEMENKKQKEGDWLVLPKEYEGKTLNYEEKANDYASFFPITGILMAILYGFKGQQEERKEKKRRSRQMLLDYSEIISRLMVFIGAGMTIRSAWGKIVLDYEKRIEAGKGKQRYAYEEMSRTYYQICTGKPEGEAYEEFGIRCSLQPYMKLSGLLIQNRKEGMKNLNQVMKLEMACAFEERKNLARRQGEEAGTKLLVPLFLMLGVVMVMIMAPAMMAFS